MSIMQFRRRLTILAALIFTVYICWMWLSASIYYMPSTLTSLSDETQQQQLRVRESLAKSKQNLNQVPHKYVVNMTLQKLGANMTLQKLRTNMTLLKVNMSNLQNIIHRANSSLLIKKSNALNPHQFSYLLNTESTCHGNVFMLIYVHTAPKNHKRRSVIRQTWGKFQQYPMPIRVIFVMGKTFDGGSTVQDALTYESDVYRDIVQEDFIDSYHNLTYKGIAGLKWVSTYCTNAKFVLKTDDDIFVNMYTLIRHLKSMDALAVNSKRLLLCLVWNRMKVMRVGKWKVAKEEFKDEYYPTYCSGSAYIMSTDLVMSMYKVSYDVPFFWVDDFYITGLLPMKVGNITHKQFMSTYVLDGRELKAKFNGPQWFSYIFSHVHDLDAVQAVWEKLVKLAKGQIAVDLKVIIPGKT